MRLYKYTFICICINRPWCCELNLNSSFLSIEADMKTRCCKKFHGTTEKKSFDYLNKKSKTNKKKIPRDYMIE